MASYKFLRMYAYMQMSLHAPVKTKPHVAAWFVRIHRVRCLKLRHLEVYKPLKLTRLRVAMPLNCLIHVTKSTRTANRAFEHCSRHGSRTEGAVDLACQPRQLTVGTRYTGIVCHMLLIQHLSIIARAALWVTAACSEVSAKM